MLYSNPFKRFYDTEIKIVKITTGGGYSDRGNKKTEELCTVMCDLQNYNGGLAEKEYGLSVSCQYRMFSNTNEHIKEGNYVIAEGQAYQIKYVENWKFGAVAILARE